MPAAKKKTPGRKKKAPARKKRAAKKAEAPEPDYSDLSDNQLRELVASLSGDVEKLERASAYMHFRPFPFQVPWYTSERQVKLLLAGNQVGKSTYGVISTLRGCLGRDPLSLGGKRAKGWGKDKLKGKRFLAAGETFDVALRDTIIPKIREFVTDDMLASKPRKNSLGLETTWKFVTGAELVLMSYQQGKDAFEGPVWDGVWLDEPPPQSIFNGIRRGTMARQGSICITATPLKEPWMLDELVLPAQSPDDPSHDKIAYFRADMHDNCKDCRGGALPHAQIEAFLASLPEKERNARAHGLFMDLQGLEFDYVNPDEHVVPDFNLYPGWPLVEVVDPAQARGLHMIWATCDPDDYWYVIHAAQVENDAFSRMCREIKRQRAQLGRTPDLAIMDARGGAHTINLEKQQTWFDAFREHGIDYVPSTETPLQTLHDWMRPAWNPVKSEKEIPKLRLTKMVADMEKGPMWAFRRFVWSPTASDKKQYSQPGKDWIDCIRYLAGYDGMKYARLTRSGRPTQMSRAESYASPSRSNPNQPRLRRSGGKARSYTSQRPGWTTQIRGSYS